MKRSIIQSAIIALALMLSASLTLAADDKAGAAGETKKISSPAKAEKNAPKKAAPAAKVKLVDINSAGKAELKTLPGISDAEADKIIAGRPYLSKANLLTQNIVSSEAYEQLKGRVIAKQNKASAAKLAEKQKAR